jgi:hypothetical protein
VTVPELGLNGQRVDRDHVLVFPPFLPVHCQWERGTAQTTALTRIDPHSLWKTKPLCRCVGRPISGGSSVFWHLARMILFTSDIPILKE